MSLRSRIPACVLLMIPLSQTVALAQETPDTRIVALLKAPDSGYANAHWGLLVVDRKTGAVVYQKNPDQLFCPASVTKLFTTAAILADFGADYRFRTPVVRQGEVDKAGTLHGDLILVAQGDLSFGGRTGPEESLLFKDDDHTYSGGNNRSELVAADPLAGLDHLAKEIRAAGIKRVEGEILIDDRLFAAAESTGSGPSRVSPILINDNLIDIVVIPGAKPGDPAVVELVPKPPQIGCDARVETVESAGETAIEVSKIGAGKFRVSGKIAVGHNPVVKVFEVDDPASSARSLFIETLRRREILVDATALADNPWDKLPSREVVKGLPKVAEYVSPKLPEYLKVILKVSHNLHASTLPLLLAAHHDETTLSEGLKREGEILKGLGVDVDSISFGGGAGGSRSDLATPRATVALLMKMASRPDFAAYEAALPILGQDGTLARAVPADSPARGHARAKTGSYWVDNSLNGHVVLTSKALAGYMETASGRPLVFAFFLNNVPVEAKGLGISEASAAAGRYLGKICEAFYLEGAAPPK